MTSRINRNSKVLFVFRKLHHRNNYVSKSTYILNVDKIILNISSYLIIMHIKQIPNKIKRTKVLLTCSVFVVGNIENKKQKSADSYISMGQLTET